MEGGIGIGMVEVMVKEMVLIEPNSGPRQI